MTTLTLHTPATTLLSAETDLNSSIVEHSKVNQLLQQLLIRAMSIESTEGSIERFDMPIKEIHSLLPDIVGPDAVRKCLRRTQACAAHAMTYASISGASCLDFFGDLGVGLFGLITKPQSELDAKIILRAFAELESEIEISTFSEQNFQILLSLLNSAHACEHTKLTTQDVRREIHSQLCAVLLYGSTLDSLWSDSINEFKHRVISDLSIALGGEKISNAATLWQWGEQNSTIIGGAGQPVPIAIIGGTGLSAGIRNINTFSTTSTSSESSSVTRLYRVEEEPVESKGVAQKAIDQFNVIKRKLFPQSTLVEQGSALVSEYFRSGKLERRNVYPLLTDVSGHTHAISWSFSEKALGTDIQKINIITGSCLWSAEGARALTEDGDVCSLVDPTNEPKTKIAKLLLNQDLTLYELDTIKRLTNLAIAIKSGALPIDVFLNIPSLEYRIYLLDALRRGHMTPNVYAAWCQSVEERSDRLIAEFQNRLGSIGAVREISLLEPIRGILTSVSDSGHVPEKLLMNACELLSESSPLWKIALQWQQQKAQERGLEVTWEDINRLGYSLAQLQVADTSADAFKLTIALDNRHERPIYDRGDRLNRHLKVPVRLIGAFSHELIARTAPTGALEFDNLYFNDDKLSLLEKKRLGLF